jgi:predicted small lipoprotein YifL
VSEHERLDIDVGRTARLHIVAILLLAGTLIGCGTSGPVPPTESQAREVVEQRAKERGWTVLSLHKTDGVLSIKDGVPHYRMYYKGAFRVLADGSRIERITGWNYR